MLNFYDKIILSQSDAAISEGYNSYCNLLLISSFMKQGPGIFNHTLLDPPEDRFVMFNIYCFNVYSMNQAFKMANPYKFGENNEEHETLGNIK